MLERPLRMHLERGRYTLIHISQPYSRRHRGELAEMVERMMLRMHLAARSPKISVFLPTADTREFDSHA